MPVQKASTLGLEPSFGFGDRLGLATPGHLDALKREGGAASGGGGIKPIFAQQSIREMTRTKRNPTQVMTAAVEALKKENYTGKWGADADHLKTEEDVDYTAAAGFVFFTIDPSAHVDTHADGYDANALEKKFDDVKAQTPWIKHYHEKTVAIKDGPTIKFEGAAVKRAAVKYGRAIEHTKKIAAHIAKVMKARASGGYEIELSVDETPEPTTLAEHYIIADQLGPKSINLVSLAPRFIGDLEKGVDYKGDLAALEKSLQDHAAIARQLGPYKLSLHSGSDKLSMYPLFARATRGMFHVKTAGTSYLEALRVVARHDNKLFREIVDFSRSRYDTDKATYHVSARVSDAPPPAEVKEGRQLERIYLEDWSTVPKGAGFTNPGRQIMHCTFGSVLTHEKFGPAVRGVLEAHPDTHRAVLADHFARHLSALRSGM